MKLKAAEIDGTPLKWFQSYLSDRYQSVLWNNDLSKPLPLKRDVPQGSILGLTLFFVIIHDMPSCLTLKIATTSSKVTGYADDTTVYEKSKTFQKFHVPRRPNRLEKFSI